MARLHLFKKLKERLIARLEKWIAALQEKAIELNFELLEAKGFIVLKDIQLKKEIPSTFVSYFLIGPHSLICMDVRNWNAKNSTVHFLNLSQKNNICIGLLSLPCL